MGVAGTLLHYKHKRVPFKSLFIRNARAHTKPGVGVRVGGGNNSNNKKNKNVKPVDGLNQTSRK